MLASFLPQLDLWEVQTRLRAVGSWGFLAVVPYPLILLLDSLGWMALFEREERPPLKTLLAARLLAESASQCVPSAGLAGEAAALWKISGPRGRPIAAVMGTLLLRRILMALGHGLALGLAALVTSAGLSSRTSPGQGFVLTLASVALLTLAAGGLSLAKAGPASRLPVALSRLPLPDSFRARLAEQVSRFSETDRRLARFFTEPGGRRIVPATLFLLVFLAESAETWLILTLLGSSLSFADVLSFEALLSLARALAFFVPAGLGVQDAGYLGALSLAGVPHAASVGAAFVVVKRGKEALWTAVGLVVFVAAGRGAALPEGGESDGIAADPLHRRIAQPDIADAPDREGAPRP